mmetsp:Transcript_116034/g.322613  ORF Transcript_116034/g.322613 Transcript_116034/m.322613 type:complete len:229 (+) Transcript_116034:448-1134(+)
MLPVRPGPPLEALAVEAIELHCRHVLQPPPLQVVDHIAFLHGAAATALAEDDDLRLGVCHGALARRDRRGLLGGSLGRSAAQELHGGLGAGRAAQLRQGRGRRREARESPRGARGARPRAGAEVPGQGRQAELRRDGRCTVPALSVFAPGPGISELVDDISRAHLPLQQQPARLVQHAARTGVRCIVGAGRLPFSRRRAVLRRVDDASPQRVRNGLGPMRLLHRRHWP